MKSYEKVKQMLDNQNKIFWEVLDKEQITHDIIINNISEIKEYLIERIHNKIKCEELITEAYGKYHYLIAQDIINNCNKILKEVQ